MKQQIPSLPVLKSGSDRRAGLLSGSGHQSTKRKENSKKEGDRRWIMEVVAQKLMLGNAGGDEWVAAIWQTTIPVRKR